MPRAGRRRSVVWACFVENAASGKRRVLCRFCDHDLVANPIRMVRHIVKHCPNADEQHKKICREYQTLTVPLRRRGGDDDDGQHSDALHGAYPSAPTPHALPPEVPPSVALSFGLPHAVAQFAIASLQQSDGTDPHAPTHCTEAHPISPAPDRSVVERVHDELALALATTEGSPLALLDNPRFARALQMVHVPVMTAADIETCVVPRLCKRVESEALAAMETATTITVQITALTVEGNDTGWDVFAADQDHRQAPLERLPFTASQETLASLVCSRFSQLPRKPACELHLCTDTFGIAARAFSVVDPHPQLSAAPVFVSGCLMQASLLLLARIVEITPRLRHAVDACAIVSERVALDSSLQSHLEGEFTVSHLDDESSLWSLLAVVDQVVRHQDALRGVAVSQPLPFVGDHAFWCDAKTTREMLHPFGFLIALSDCGHLNSSMVLVSWLMLWATAVHSSVLTEEEKTAIASTVLAHIQRHGLPLAMVCLALDPRCRGLGLSARGKRKVRAMVVATAQQFNAEVDQSALLEHVVKYLNSERPFDDEASWQMMASLPRLFWVEYNAEAHELASVALASLSFRPYIHSLQHTWTIAGASPSSSTEPRPSHHKEISTLKRLAFQLDMTEKATSDDRKQALAIAARLLVMCSGNAPSSEVVGATASSYSSVLPAASPHAFWTRLRRVAKTLALEEDASTGNETDGGDTVDAAWFAVDASGAVLQLQTCLQRALFGDDTELRVDSLDHVDAHAQGREQVASPPVEESASAILSGLEGLENESTTGRGRSLLMGPPAPTPKRDASSAAAHSRTDAVRTRERRSAHSAGGESSASFATAAVEQVEWASPTSIRARSRPSNLHSYLWSNGSFPLSAAASPRPVRRSGGSMSSGGSTGVASPRQSRLGRLRSQSTRATQTSATDFLISSQEGDSSTTISLGAYGDISRMGMDTVNYLIQALEERRHDLLQEEKAPTRTRDASINPQTESTKRAGSRQVNRSTGANDGAVHVIQPPGGDGVSSAEEAVGRGRVRSRSYEALAKLEQILEARHQHLMQDGALDGAAGLSLHGPAGSDLTDEIRKLQQSFLQEARRHR